MSPTKAAKVYKVSVPKLLRLIASGHLPASNLNPGGKKPRWWIRVSDLEAFFQPSNTIVKRPRNRKRLDKAPAAGQGEFG